MEWLVFGSCTWSIPHLAFNYYTPRLCTCPAYTESTCAPVDMTSLVTQNFIHHILSIHFLDFFQKLPIGYPGKTIPMKLYWPQIKTDITLCSYASPQAYTAWPAVPDSKPDLCTMSSVHPSPDCQKMGVSTDLAVASPVSQNEHASQLCVSDSDHTNDQISKTLKSKSIKSDYIRYGSSQNWIFCFEVVFFWGVGGGWVRGVVMVLRAWGGHGTAKFKYKG